VVCFVLISVNMSDFDDAELIFKRFWGIWDFDFPYFTPNWTQARVTDGAFWPWPGNRPWPGNS
jgi:hypothetical protein